MLNLLGEAVVRKAVRMSVQIQRTFSVFMEQMETWWPATHHIGKTPFDSIIVEPRVGGRWYEGDVEGQMADWGTVLAWDPPNRVPFFVAAWSRTLPAGLEVRSKYCRGQ